MDAAELAAWRNRRRYHRSAWGRPRMPIPPDGPDDDGQVHYGDCGDIRVDTTARGTEFPLIYIGDTPFDPETLRRDAAAMLAAALESEK
ncbi:hypothetical protein TAJ_75 [Mycobacterium phage Taj]|uniref:Uncharacterized protein n=2 Tax=Cheoctovirus TaxID=1623281 RepID=E7EJU2_9CAUD|nr:hypothetical protein PBI_WEE_75 [Mycobacterium phage Wee]YP_009100187.1 hypothetical protein TAJ_75 [Mycobacterium phage Taj]ADU15946.1 hypothetical protein PBI_WEE_75 [Mycobacterium phage Wee]AFO10199.1 hypothetical protein TAJ_75 [Mycobacterium phage Taj]